MLCFSLETIFSISKSLLTNSICSYFIPNDLSYGNALDFRWENNKLIVKLNENYDHGQGTIRLIAIDSYSTSENFTTYIDIPVVICDGSEEYPYQIISEKDLQIFTNLFVI